MISVSRFISGVFWSVIIIGVINCLILLFSGTFMYGYMEDNMEDGYNVFLGDDNIKPAQVKKDTFNIKQITSKK